MAPKKIKKTPVNKGAKAKGRGRGKGTKGALKKPAAADANEDWQLAAKAAGIKATFNKDTEEGTRKEGEADARQTSLAQRHVFKMSRESLEPSVLERYDHLKSPACKTKGKERLANEIINAYVPRDCGYGGQLVPDKMAITRVFTREHTTKDGG